MSSRSMDVSSIARRIALPYLTLVERRRFIETLDSTSVREDRAEFSPFHASPSVLLHLFDFVFNGTVIIGSKFSLTLDETRDGHGRADQRQDFVHGREIYLNARVSCYSRIMPGLE